MKSRIKNLKYSSELITTSVAQTVDAFLEKHGPAIPLGPAYSSMHLCDVDENLRLFRASKNWEIPSVANENERRERSIFAMLNSDREGLTSFDKSVLSDDLICQLNRIRFSLHKNVSRHYRFKTDKLRMPKGETLVSAKGDVSVLAKLRDVSQWCCTSDAFDHAAEVIYNTPSLKASARRHFVKYTHKELEFLNSCFYGIPNAGYEVFKCRLLDFITIVPGMRLATVPKDNNKDRVIGCEPFLNMLCQSVVEEGIRSMIKTCYGIDLRNSQDLHHLKIADLDYATVDFANASNSSFMCVLEFLFKGTQLYTDILSCRSPVATYDGQCYDLNMVSPMGNGFTFGYMTLVILAIARSFDQSAMVFGDDLIIKSSVYKPCIEILSSIGYEINTSKTFTTGTFRESCGAFWSNDHYITSFELEYPVDLISAIVITNKIGIMAQEGDIRWAQLHSQLVRLFPPIFYGWYQWTLGVRDERLGPDEVYTPAFKRKYDIPSSYVSVYRKSDMRKKRTDTDSRLLWKKKIDRNRNELYEIQYEPEHVTLLVQAEYVIDTYRALPKENVSPFWYGHYLWAGRCSAPTRRTPAHKRKVYFTQDLVPYWSRDITQM